MFLVYAWIIDFPVSAQFRFVMPWQILACWGCWSCRNCSEDWPLLQKALYVKGNHYCPPVSVLCSWISQTSAHLIWCQYWPGLSNRRGTINKIYSWTQPKEVSLLKDLGFHDTFILSYLQRRWGHQVPSLGAVLVALTSRPQPLAAILTLTADLSCQTIHQPPSLDHNTHYLYVLC